VRIFDLLNYFGDLVVDISALTHHATDFFGGVHNRRVVTITEVVADLW